ncbi:MAG: PH domain-containing protein [Patescibacteria group bacterium]|nr:PH domain-containing protein [Patescibacteria group bacterium]
MLKFFLPHKKDNETIILLLRRHPFTIFLKIIFWLMVALLPPVFYGFLVNGDILGDFFTSTIIWPIILLALSIYYLFVWVLIFYSYVDYYLDVWIITTHRIVNIEQAGLFDRVISEQELYRVQDITSEVKGIFPTLINYGTVYIQTAAEQERFTFKQVPNPNEVARKITKLVEDSKRAHQLMVADTINDEKGSI